MHKISSIRPFVAAVMLLVFAFAVTPQRFVHNLVADHSDTAYSKTSPRKAELSKPGFSCQVDNLVATSPFKETDERFVLKPLVSFASYHAEITSPHLRSSHITLTPRGPPALDYI